jgi:ubiquitin carboxyl-terminal hydrolase 7
MNKVMDDDDDLTVSTASTASTSSTEGEPDPTNQPIHKMPEEESIALLSLRRVFKDMEEASGTVAPRVLCESLGIPVFQQQDSQEFWKLLLPAMKLAALTDLYTGSYQDYIVALDGSGRERRREETFLDLSLDIHHGSVQAALRHQFKNPELLSKAEGNGWRPEKGLDKVDAHKGQLLLQRGLPSILQLHLKRFHFDWNTETTSKVNDQFKFPAVLDLADIVNECDGSSENLCYDLHAVVVHVGEFNSGHYYAYVRPDITSDVWYRFNDHVVTEVCYDDVIRDAYGGEDLSFLSVPDDDEAEDTSKRNFLYRICRTIFGFGNSDAADPYGFGGKCGNAYVLQYVRRCDEERMFSLNTK